MNVRDAFGLAVRIGGAWQILRGLDDIYYLVAKIFNLPTGSTLSIQVDFDACLFNCLLGLLILFGANWIVRLAYGRTAS